MGTIEERMRADLATAIRSRDLAAVRALRTGLAALANAEAPPSDGRWVEPEVGRLVEHERLDLTETDRVRLLERELADRDAAVAEYEAIGRAAEAAELQAEAAVLRRHVLAVTAAVVEVDHRDPAVAATLAELQRASYALEAALIGFEGIPGLRATAEDVATTDHRWLARVAGDELVAATALEIDGTDGTIAVLVVHPDHLRMGHGRALVQAAVTQPGVDRWIVGTGGENAPALALYRSLGFSDLDRVELAVPYVRLALEPSRS